MNEENPSYHKYFSVGLRIEVRFPSPSDTTFRDWAVITRFVEDLVELRLSRDLMPENVGAETGTILVLRNGNKGGAYCCRAIVVAEQDGATVTARLIGEVIPDELRDFYRIDAYIPIRYRAPEGKSAEEITEEWRAGRYPGNGFRERARAASPSHWHDTDTETPRPTPVAANISGSGIRVRIPESLKPGDLLAMELHLPLSPPRFIPVVGQVVHAGRVRTKPGERPLYSAALHFLCIDERDRDAVVMFVSSVQIEQLRATGRGSISIADPEYTGHARKMRLRRIVFTVILLTLLSTILTGLVLSRLNGGKGEIEQNYEREITKYRKIFPWR